MVEVVSEWWEQNRGRFDLHSYQIMINCECSLMPAVNLSSYIAILLDLFYVVVMKSIFFFFSGNVSNGRENLVITIPET